MKRVVKAGGVVCIVTELILTEHRHDQYFSYEEMNDFFLSDPALKLVGGDLDLTISESLICYPTDVINSKHVARSPHVVLKEGEMLWTSLSLFLQKM